MTRAPFLVLMLFGACADPPAPCAEPPPCPRPAPCPAPAPDPLRMPAPIDRSGDARTKVVLLGTGTPNAVPARSGPAVAVVVDGAPYLVDCGPGVVRRAQAAFENGVAGANAESLARLFLTHLHSDHTAGYADVILSPWVLGRKTPLEVYGPPGTRKMTDHLLQAYSEDIAVRLHGKQPAEDGGHVVNVHEVSNGEIYRDQRVTVRAFPVRHGEWKHALGFRFESADRVVVVSGDTVPVDAVVEACAGCDVLVHEVYSQTGFAGRPADWQAYHRASHTSGPELAEIAIRARPKLLVLYHQLLWGASERQLLDEVTARYDGAVAYANDLDVF